MKLDEFNDKGERMVLDHEPVPPYGTAFWITFLGGMAYLAYILVSTWGHSVPGH